MAVVIDVWLGEALGETVAVNYRAKLALLPVSVWRKIERDKYLRFFIIRFEGPMYSTAKGMILILGFTTDRQVKICS